MPPYWWLQDLENLWQSLQGTWPVWWSYCPSNQLKFTIETLYDILNHTAEVLIHHCDTVANASWNLVSTTIVAQSFTRHFSRDANFRNSLNMLQSIYYCFQVLNVFNAYPKMGSNVLNLILLMSEFLINPTRWMCKSAFWSFFHVVYVRLQTEFHHSELAEV